MLGTPSAANNRPQSDRADDALPRGTVFRWNPYVATPTSLNRADSSSFIGTKAVGAAGGGVTPGGSAPVTPYTIVSPRNESAAANHSGLTPLVDEHGMERSGALAPSDGQTPTLFAAYRSLFAANAAAASGGSPNADGVVEGNEPTLIQVNETTQLSSAASNIVERVIVHFLQEPRDAAVREAVLAMELAESQRIYAYLVKNLAVTDFLARKHRGKLIADAIEAAAESLRSADLFRWMMVRLPSLSFDQSGCITVTRVYDVVSDAHRAQLDDWVALNFVELASDSYGNYVVQRVVAHGDPAILESFGRQLRSRGVIGTLTKSKAGSHVVEKFVTKVDLVTALPVCQAIALDDPDLTTDLANDRYGNYVLQAALKKVFAAATSPLPPSKAAPPAPAPGQSVLPLPTSTPTVSPKGPTGAISGNLQDSVDALARRCLEQVPELVAPCRHAQNVCRSMGMKTSHPDGSKGDANERKDRAGGGGTQDAGDGAAKKATRPNAAHLRRRQGSKK